MSRACIALALLLAACTGSLNGRAAGSADDEQPGPVGGKASPGDPSAKPPPSGAGGSGYGLSDASTVQPPSGSTDDGAAGAPGGGADAGAPIAEGDAAAGAPPPCSVAITPVLPPRLLDLLAGSDKRLRLHADVSGTQAPVMPTWMWQVSHESAGAIPAAPMAGDPSTVEIPLAQPGRYTIRAEVSPTCSATEIATAVLPGERVSTLLVRVTPAYGSTLPPQETTVEVSGGHAAVKDFALSAGKPVTIDPRRPEPDRPTIPSYIRISSADSAIRFEGHTIEDKFVAALDSRRSYDVLVIPDGAVAPALVRRTYPAQLAALPFIFDEGTLVEGKVLASANVPLEGARVLLRAAALPSTIGRTDAQGAFQLRARPERFSALVIPPPDRGLPDAHLPEGALAVGLVPVDLTFVYKTLPSKRLDVQVTDAAGAAPSMPVRVRVESEAGALPDVGSFEVGPDVRLTASGSVRAEATTNAGGFVSFARLPTTRYRVIALPATGALDAAITEAVIDATASGPHKLALERPLALRGRLEPAATAAHLRIIAVDSDVDAPGEPITAMVDDQGRFTLAAAPRRTYRLYTEPAPEKKLPRLLLGLAKAGGAELVLTLPGTVSMGGRITAGADVLPGAVIQVFCTALTPDCLGDPTSPSAGSVRPVSETVTGPDGRYQVEVPDPAQWNL